MVNSPDQFHGIAALAGIGREQFSGPILFLQHIETQVSSSSQFPSMQGK